MSWTTEKCQAEIQMQKETAFSHTPPDLGDNWASVLQIWSGFDSALTRWMNLQAVVIFKSIHIQTLFSDTETTTTSCTMHNTVDLN